MLIPLVSNYLNMMIEYELITIIIIIQIKLSWFFFCRLVSYPWLQGWGASCPGRFILPLESYFFLCSFTYFEISEYEVVSFIIIIQVKLRCFLCRLVSSPELQGWVAGCPGQFILPPPRYSFFLCSFHLFRTI